MISISMEKHTLAVLKKIQILQSNVETIKKSKKNEFHNKKYAQLHNIQNVIKSELTKLKLGYTQSVTELGLETIIYDDEDNYYVRTYPIDMHSIAKLQDQGSAITYIKRYQLTAMLGLIIEDEDDDLGDGTKSTKNPSYYKTDNKDTNNAIYANMQQNEPEPCWLQEEQFEALVSSTDSVLIQSNIHQLGKPIATGINTGKIYKMKKDYKTKLENRIKELNN